MDLGIDWFRQMLGTNSSCSFKDTLYAEAGTTVHDKDDGWANL